MLDPTNRNDRHDLSRYNFGIVPDTVPGDLADQPSLTDDLFRQHERYCNSVKASRVLLTVNAARAIEEQTKQLLPFLFDHDGPDQLQNAAATIESIHVANGNRTILLLDFTERFFGVVPPLAETAGIADDLYPVYERISAPMRLRLLVTRESENCRSIDFAPIFSQPAFTELIEHLAVAARYVASPLKEAGATRRDIPFASCLLDLMVAELNLELQSGTKGAQSNAGQWLSDIESIRLLSSTQYEIVANIDSLAGNVGKGQLVHSSHREQLSFIADLDKYGRLEMVLANRERL